MGKNCPEEIDSILADGLGEASRFAILSSTRRAEEVPPKKLGRQFNRFLSFLFSFLDPGNYRADLEPKRENSGHDETGRSNGIPIAPVSRVRLESLMRARAECRGKLSGSLLTMEKL